MHSLIDLHIVDGAAEIVLSRQEKKNALSVEMWEAIPDLVATANSSENATAIILHGGDCFAAGADISEFGALYQSNEGASRGAAAIGAALEALETSPKSVIAAIEGPCIGGGVSLAMACDYRIAGTGSRFGVTPARIGLVYPAGDTRRLLAAIGPSKARLLLFTGRIIDHDVASDMGLIDECVDQGSALKTAHALCKEIATRSQWSVRATKAMLQGLRSGWTDTSPEAEALFLESFRNPDFVEGQRAFTEKRSPKFPIR